MTVAGSKTLPGTNDPVADQTHTTHTVMIHEYLHAEICGQYSLGNGYLWPCDQAVDHSALACGDRPVVLPLWEHHRTHETDPWSDWSLVHDATCQTPTAPTPEQILTEFRRLPLTPSTLTMQPPTGTVLVHKPTIAYTDPVPQTLSTTVLGATVTFTVTPATYTWDYGTADGTFTTTSPGHPYPDQDVSYTYRHTGSGRITLTTTWTATYTLGDDLTARDVPGTAATRTTGRTFDIVAATPKLVAGTCAEYPHTWGCP